MKLMNVIIESSSKKIAKRANEEQIASTDIVSIVYREGEFVMFYYQ